jgi:hypothetical protein
MKSIHRVILSILLCLFCVAPVFADSDSFYCTGKGYIAFDLRSFIHPDLKSPHVLRLYRFDSRQGVYKAAEWPMRDFQIHTMRCTRDRIVVAGSEDAHYVFDATPETAEPEANAPISSLAGQLGWSVPGVKTLESDDPEHSYQLIISVSTKDTETTWKAEILEMDSQQKRLHRILLYERHSEQEMGD